MNDASSTNTHIRPKSGWGLLDCSICKAYEKSWYKAWALLQKEINKAKNFQTHIAGVYHGSPTVSGSGSEIQSTFLDS